MLVNETHVVFSFSIFSISSNSSLKFKKKSINDIIKEFKSIKNYVINVVYLLTLI